MIVPLCISLNVIVKKTYLPVVVVVRNSGMNQQHYIGQKDKQYCGYSLNHHLILNLQIYLFDGFIRKNYKHPTFPKRLPDGKKV